MLEKKEVVGEDFKLIQIAYPYNRYWLYKSKVVYADDLDKKRIDFKIDSYDITLDCAISKIANRRLNEESYAVKEFLKLRNEEISKLQYLKKEFNHV